MFNVGGVSDHCEWCHLCAGGPGCCKKKAEQARKSKVANGVHSFVDSAPHPASRFLLWFPSVDCDPGGESLINPFLSKMLLGRLSVVVQQCKG